MKSFISSLLPGSLCLRIIMNDNINETKSRINEPDARRMCTARKPGKVRKFPRFLPLLRLSRFVQARLGRNLTVSSLICFRY